MKFFIFVQTDDGSWTWHDAEILRSGLKSFEVVHDGFTISFEWAQVRNFAMVKQK